MIVELIPGPGVGHGQPLRLHVTQVVVYQDNGTPIAAAAEYGPDRAQALSIVGNEDFNRVLRNLGIKKSVICDRIQLPAPPPGAKLLYDPRQPRTP